MNEHEKQIRHYTDRIQVLGQPICLEAVRLNSGINILLTGGHCPHIGAVIVVPPEGEPALHVFPGHREEVICRKWAECLTLAGQRPAVTSAGIHYHGIDREDIQAVLQATDTLLERLLEALTEKERPLVTARPHEMLLHHMNTMRPEEEQPFTAQTRRNQRLENCLHCC